MTVLGTLLVLAAMVQTPSSIVVRRGEATTTIRVLVTQRGPMVRLEEALTPLGAVLLRNSTDRFRLVAGGAEINLSLGVAAATTRGRTEQLAAAPALFEGKLLVPLSLMTDLLPRVASGFVWDAALGELRRDAVVAAEKAPVVTPRPPPASRQPRAEPQVRRAPVRHVIVIDAGHGGPDRGMKGPVRAGNRFQEADITLGVARRVRDVLRRRGFDVVMTRTTDTLIALADRGHIDNRARKREYISINVNAANPRWRRPQDARGFETYFLSTAKTDDERRVEEMENEAVKYEGEEAVSTDDPLSFILNDMKQNEYLRESSDLAVGIQRSLAGIPHPGVDRGVKQAGFRVLVAAYMPSVLVEIGFGTNAAEARWMSGATGQTAIAAAIASATAAYLDRLDRRTASGVPPE